MNPSNHEAVQKLTQLFQHNEVTRFSHEDLELDEIQAYLANLAFALGQAQDFFELEGTQELITKKVTKIDLDHLLYILISTMISEGIVSKENIADEVVNTHKIKFFNREIVYHFLSGKLNFLIPYAPAIFEWIVRKTKKNNASDSVVKPTLLEIEAETDTYNEQFLNLAIQKIRQYLFTYSNQNNTD